LFSDVGELGSYSPSAFNLRLTEKRNVTERVTEFSIL
jgi:hypothetical protein